MYYLLKSEPTSIKDWLPLVSVGVTLLLFTIDRIIAISIRRREVKRTWYLKVLIDPHINRISIFFDSVGDAYEKAATAIGGARGNTDFLQIKAINFEKYTDLKRELEAYLIRPLEPQYFEVAEKLTEELNNLQDIFTSSLDNEQFSKDNITSFRIQVYNIKAKLMDILYSPLAKKK